MTWVKRESKYYKESLALIFFVVSYVCGLGLTMYAIDIPNIDVMVFFLVLANWILTIGGIIAFCFAYLDLKQKRIEKEIK